MTLREEQERVQQAVSRSLVHVREDPWLAQRVLANAKGEEPVRKKITGAVVLCMVLVLAVIGTACALFSSQVADFFGLHWNRDLGERLREGKVAQIGETVTIGDVAFTLDEVVYHSRGLYGVGTARAVHENDVLLPEEYANAGEYFAESAEALALAEQAKTQGGRLLTISALPGKVGVDGGTLLQPGSIGYYDLRNEDGSLTFSFETEDGFAISDGESYQIEMESRVEELDFSGNSLGIIGGETWLVAFTPVAMTEEKEETSAVPMADIPQDGYELLIPAQYEETGTLPIYRATETDFRQLVDPIWFNRSGIQEQRRDNFYLFNDHAELSISAELIGYSEYTGEKYDYNEREREQYQPELEPMYGPVPALTQAITGIASNIYTNAFFMRREEVSLAHEVLTNISLAESQAQAEAMLACLHLSGYELAWALDMDVARIRSLGAAYNRYWYEGNGTTNLPRQDFDQVTAADEGYYLRYTPLGVTDVSDTRHEIGFYVTARGIVNAHIRSNFTRSELLRTPDAMIAPQVAVARLYEEAAKVGVEIKSIERVALTYRTARAANKAEGMVFVPAWQVRYLDAAHPDLSYTDWVDFDAETGEMLDGQLRMW